MTSNSTFGPAYWAAGVDNSTNAYILKAAVYNATTMVPMSVSFDGVDSGATAQLTVLTASSATSQNEFGGSNVVDTSVSTVTAGTGGAFSFNLPNYSIALLVTT